TLGARHRGARSALRTLLHVAEGSGSTVLLVPVGLHGVDVGRGYVREHHPAGRFLGTYEPFFVPSDRLLAPQPECTRRRFNGADCDRGGRALPPARNVA